MITEVHLDLLVNRTYEFVLVSCDRSLLPARCVVMIVWVFVCVSGAVCVGWYDTQDSQIYDVQTRVHNRNINAQTALNPPIFMRALGVPKSKITHTLASNHINRALVTSKTHTIYSGWTNTTADSLHCKKKEKRILHIIRYTIYAKSNMGHLAHAALRVCVHHSMSWTNKCKLNIVFATVLR